MQAWDTKLVGFAKTQAKVFVRVCSQYYGSRIQESTQAAYQDHKEQEQRRGCDMDSIQSCREEIQGAVSAP